MSLKYCVGGIALCFVMTFSGCGDDKPAPAEKAPAAAPAPAATPASAPAARSSAPVKTKKDDSEGVEFQAGKNGGSLKVDDGKTETEIDIKKGSVGFKVKQ